MWNTETGNGVAEYKLSVFEHVVLMLNVGTMKPSKL